MVWRSEMCLAASVFVGLSGSRAMAQFSAYGLQAGQINSARVFAVENGIFGGMAPEGTSEFQPVVWSSVSAALVNLAPEPGASIGFVYAIHGGVQYGSWFGRAATWSSGTASSFVDLHPAGAGFSQVFAAHSGRQAGWARFGQSDNAVLWSGSAGSFVNLHPAGALISTVNAMTATHQGGQVDVGGGSYNAALWSGTAASFVDMRPAGRIQSDILGMHGNQQVGWARAPLANDHAAMWNGTPESYQDMHPFPDGLSQMLATCGTAQVGYVNSAVIGSGIKAGIWFGTPESFINLTQFLPPGYGQSIATCVEERDGIFTVGGYVRYGTYDRAFVWVGVPAPSSAAALLTSGLWVARRKRRKD